MARERRLVFGEVADLYDRARPSYPRALITDVIERAGVAPPERMLEIGAGTGKATEQFAERGLRVLALEPDPAMASLARRSCARYDEVTVIETDFERWESGALSFRLVCCAQAWHWLDPRTRFAKARSVLQEGGLLAVFWTHPDWQRCELRESLREAYVRAGVQSVIYGPMHPDTETPELVPEWEADTATASGFGHPDTQSYRWTREYSVEEYLGLLQTHSDHALLPQATRTRLLDEVADVIRAAGGMNPMSFTTLLCLSHAC